MNRNSSRSFVVPALSGIAFILMGALFAGSAQTPPPQDAQAAPSQIQTFTANQLSDLLAPIALYPDGLLSQVLVASTYPLEVVEAQQWLPESHTLDGSQLTAPGRFVGPSPFGRIAVSARKINDAAQPAWELKSCAPGSRRIRDQKVVMPH